MFYGRYIRFASLSSLMLFTSSAFCGMPSYNGKLGAAVSGVIQSKIVQRGFAANDPRFSATIAAVGSGLTSIAGEAAIALGTGTIATVSWPAILAAGGIAAAVAGGVILVSSGDIDWLWGSDYNAQISGSRLDQFIQSNVIYSDPGTYAQLAERGSGVVSFVSSNGSISRFNILTVPCGSPCVSYRHPEQYSGVMDEAFAAPYTGQLDGSQAYWSEGFWDFQASSSESGTSGDFRLVYQYVPSTAHPLTQADLQSEPVPYLSMLKPYPELNYDLDSVRTDALSDRMLADAANIAWQNATPEALPWSPTNPVTPADVAQWRIANPSLAPTIEDFFAPATQQNSISLEPSPVTNPSTQGSGQQIDLGADPNTPAPILEPTPTAQMILAPLLGLMPDFKSLSIPAHSSICPQPSFSAFNTQYVMTTHCDLLNENREFIGVMMMLSWSVMTALIVLRA